VGTHPVLIRGGVLGYLAYYIGGDRVRALRASYDPGASLKTVPKPDVPPRDVAP
jgi:hypothetical protein